MHLEKSGVLRIDLQPQCMPRRKQNRNSKSMSYILYKNLNCISKLQAHWSDNHSCRISSSQCHETCTDIRCLEETKILSIRPIKTCNRTTLPSFGGSLTYSSGGVMGGRHPYYFMGHARFSPRSSRRISTRLPTTVDSNASWPQQPPLPLKERWQ